MKITDLLFKNSIACALELSACGTTLLGIYQDNGLMMGLGAAATAVVCGAEVVANYLTFQDMKEYPNYELSGKKEYTPENY
jgi:hypothetical protein